MVRADLAVREALGGQTDPEPEVTYEVEVTPAEQAKAGSSDTEVSYQFTIKNTGTEDDTYSIEVSDTDWLATMSTSSVAVSVGDSVKIEVVHQVLEDAEVEASDSGVLSISSENASTSASFTTTVTSEDGNGDISEPTIDLFELLNTSNRVWARMEVNWEVSGTDLATVEINIRDNEGDSVDLVIYDVSGDVASDSYYFRVRRGYGNYSVELTVTDVYGVATEIKEITL